MTYCHHADASVPISAHFQVTCSLLSAFFQLPERSMPITACLCLQQDKTTESEHTTTTSGNMRVSPNGSTLSQRGYLPPNPSTGQIDAMLAGDDTPIIGKTGPLGSSHSQTSSQGAARVAAASCTCVPVTSCHNRVVCSSLQHAAQSLRSAESCMVIQCLVQAKPGSVMPC